MKKGTIYLIAFTTLIYSCAGSMQNYDLNEEYATSLHYEGSTEGGNKSQGEEKKSDLVGVPARNFYGGDLKRGAIWWAGKGIFMEKGEVFIFDAENIADSIPFGATFPPLDLVKEKVLIKISARAEGNDAVTLYLQADDVDGIKANAKRPSQKIENSAEFKDYYFDVQDIYMQSNPKRSVNGAMINSLKFFISSSTGAFTGKIFVREIKVVPVP